MLLTADVSRPRPHDRLTWVSHYRFYPTGKSAEAISTLVFLLLLILLAKGFTITRARLKMGTSMKIGIFMTLYTITYAILFFHEQSVSGQRAHRRVTNWSPNDLTDVSPFVAVLRSGRSVVHLRESDGLRPDRAASGGLGLVCLRHCLHSHTLSPKVFVLHAIVSHV